jgi:hypothetical protein
MITRPTIESQQKIIAKLYSELGQRFTENPLVRETWDLMAGDLELQMTSLRSLGKSDWKELNVEVEGGHEKAARPLPASKISANIEGMPLHDCLAISLELEEPIILQYYARIIRLLRTKETGNALDLYITVKAHVTRLIRVVHLFSGDPLLSDRAQGLVERFEKAVQAPRIPEIPKRAASRRRTATKARPTRTRQIQAKKARKPARTRVSTLSRRSRKVTKASKPLVKKLGIRRRRVRR